MGLQDLLEIAAGIIDDVAVRDAGLLAAAVGRLRVTVFGDDAYPTFVDKAAALVHSLCQEPCPGGRVQTPRVGRHQDLPPPEPPTCPRSGVATGSHRRRVLAPGRADLPGLLTRACWADAVRSSPAGRVDLRLGVGE